jgi:hypothetical protein
MKEHLLSLSVKAIRLGCWWLLESLLKQASLAEDEVAGH